MKKKNNFPKRLTQKQEQQIQETINKVLRAIVGIQHEGRKVTISTYMEFTGLSSTTFSKSYIRELLV